MTPNYPIMLLRHEDFNIQLLQDIAIVQFSGMAVRLPYKRFEDDIKDLTLAVDSFRDKAIPLTLVCRMVEEYANEKRLTILTREQNSTGWERVCS